MVGIKSFLDNSNYWSANREEQLSILSGCLFNRQKSKLSDTVLEGVRFVINTGNTWLIELFSKPLPVSENLDMTKQELGDIEDEYDEGA